MTNRILRMITRFQRWYDSPGGIATSLVAYAAFGTYLVMR